MANSLLELTSLEIALLNDPCVYDCAVRRRDDQGSHANIVAYVVPAAGFSQDNANTRLRSHTAIDLVPDAYVLLSSLPITEDGQVDEQALAAFPVVDEQLVKSWQERLVHTPGIAQLTLAVEEQDSECQPLHLSDLLPHTNGAAAHEPTPVMAKAGGYLAGLNRERRKPAISDGGPLHNLGSVPATLPLALQCAAASSNRITYVQLNGSQVSQSYVELLDDAQRILRGLRKLGLKPGAPVILQLDRNQDFIPAFWACVIGGFIPAPIAIASAYSEANSTVAKLHNCWELLDRPFVLASGALTAEIGSAANLFGCSDFRVQNVDELRANPVDSNWHQSHPEDICLLLFTSGSTGKPKGVQQCHRSLLCMAVGASQLNNFTKNDVFLNWIGLDHVGGLVMMHIMPLLDCAAQIHVPAEFVLRNPTTWLDLIDRFRATMTWGPNFSYGLLANREKEIVGGRWDLTSMRFMLNGGEAIVAKTLRRCLQMLQPHKLPPNAIRPAWGMSETSSAVLFSDLCRYETIHDEDSFVSVGRPIPGTSFRVVSGDDQVLEEGQVGRLQVKGLPVTTGYYNNPELNREAFSSDGWLNTGDLAFIDDGRLTITGRTKDVIIVNGVNFYSHEIEAIVEEIEGVEVSFTAACPVRAAGKNTDQVAVFFNSRLQDWPQLLRLMKTIRETLLRKAGIHADYLVPLSQADISKTSIGKIQRPRLRDRFEAGEFASLLKQIDIHSANENTLPDWFYRKTWKRYQAPQLHPPDREETYLVFMDDLGLGTRICERLSGAGAGCVRVLAGEHFEQLGPGVFRINPKSRQDYEHFLQALINQGTQFDHVVHCWAYDDSDGEFASVQQLRDVQFRIVYSLLFLLQELAKTRDLGKSLRLFAITSHAHAVMSEPRVCPEKSTITGFLSSCAQEMPWLHARHIDFDLDPAGNADQLFQELAIAKSALEVAYRNGQRFVVSLVKANLLRDPMRPLPIKPGGLYLITGGLGGVGTALIRYLVQNYQPKILIIGRTPLPKDLSSIAVGPAARRVRNYRAIEETGAKFIYREIDISCVEQLNGCIAEAEQCWGQKLDGVFHLAGALPDAHDLKNHWEVMEKHCVTNEVIESFEHVFLPKVYGTWALFQTMERYPDALFVGFSSVNSLFGAASFSTYSAANSFLDAVTMAKYRQNSPAYCFNWTMWDDLGMSEDSPRNVRDAARRLGYFVLSKEQATNSMLAGLCRNHPHLMIGLDGHNGRFRPYLTGDAQPLARLAAYYMSKDEASFDGQQFKITTLQPHLGCRWVRVPQIPQTASGSVDRSLFEMREGTFSDLREPQNPIEQQIANIWREVLRLPQIGVGQSFFELGGDSLAAIRLINRLRETFRVELSVKTLFEHPTITGLAMRIADETAQIGLKSSTSAKTSASQLLSSLDHLTDQEIDTLLAGMGAMDFSQ